MHGLHYTQIYRLVETVSIPTFIKEMHS